MSFAQIRTTWLIALLVLLSGCFLLKQGHEHDLHREVTSLDRCLRSVVEMALCERFPDISGNARCPDSTHFYPQASTNLMVTHSFFGSGYGNGMLVYLWDVAAATPEILDSLFLFIDSDIKPYPMLEFNDSCNWFVARSSGGGTNHYSEHGYWVRVEENALNVLLTLELYVSDLNPESTPMRFQEFKLEVLEISQTRILVKAEMVYGNILEPEGDGEFDEEEITDHAEDIAVFVFDESKKRFVWHSSSNPLFIPFWKEEVMYHSILRCY